MAKAKTTVQPQDIPITRTRTYVSPHAKLMLWLQDEAQTEVRFQQSGIIGVFTTSDQRIIELMDTHPQSGKLFSGENINKVKSEFSSVDEQRNNIVVGVRSSDIRNI